MSFEKCSLQKLTFNNFSLHTFEWTFECNFTWGIWVDNEIFIKEFGKMSELSSEILRAYLDSMTFGCDSFDFF